MIKPVLDETFYPLIEALNDFRNKVNSFNNKVHIALAIERNNHYVYRYEMDILPNGVDDKLNQQIVERIIKTILWVVGGYKIYIAGSHEIYQYIKQVYALDGLRTFDYDFMSTCYEHTFAVVECTYDLLPKENKSEVSIGGHLKGKRIGFDAGGSDRKTSALIDGKTIFSEEVVWQPKLEEDINYHYQEIYQAFLDAYHKLGDVNAIGVSTAGVIIDQKPMVSSLFIKTKKEDFEKQKFIYINCVKKLEKEVGHPIPFEVANDGDVTALAGAIDVKDNGVLGIAMGTSEAVGYVNKDGLLDGWLNELAFVPVDLQDNLPIDEWSKDYGVGCKYLSQDAVIRLADRVNIKLDDKLSLGEKLKVVQNLANNNDESALKIFETIGVYLAYSIAYYAEFYQIKHLMLLGRVMSGKGGDTIMEVAQKTLYSEFPQYQNIKFHVPSEYMRRVGQSIAAASLPKDL